MSTQYHRSISRSHSPSRSPSEDRLRTRTYKENTDSYSTDYSDDFEHDSRSGSVTPPRKGKHGAKPGRRRTPNPYSSNNSSIHLHSSATSKKTTQSSQHYKRSSRRTTGARKHGWKSHSFSKDRSFHKSAQDNIATRMLSAKQHQIDEIQNELFITKQRLDELEKENRLLKTLQHRQDKALRRFEDAESDLPRLIAQNNEDQRVLKTRLRKTQEAERALESKLKGNNDEMQKMEGMLRRLKKIVYDKNLGERSELARQLTNTENQMVVAERKVKELEKKLELTMSSFTRQINTERHKHKETKEKLEALHEDYLNIKTKLKEKERALDVSNIYSLRKKEPTEKALVPASVVSSPRRPVHDMTSSTTQTDFALTQVSSISDTSQSVVLASNLLLPKPKNDVPEYKKQSEIQQDFRKTIIVTSSKSPALNGEMADAQPENHTAPDRLLSNSGSKGVKGRQGNNQSVFLTANFESPMSSPNTSFMADSREKIKPENAQSSPIQTNIQQDLELNDMVDESKEMQKREEERQKLEEKQKQKIELLAKMREIEEEKSNLLSLDTINKSPQISKTVNMSPKSKAQLVKSLLENDSDNVVENLHLGIPSTVDSGKKKPEHPQREISFGSYAPTVGGAPTRRKARTNQRASKPVSSESDNDEPLFDLNSGQKIKKSDLLTQLFGTQDNDSSSNFLSEESQKQQSRSRRNDTISRAKPVHSGYPWEKNVVSSMMQGNGDTSEIRNKLADSHSLIKSVSSTNDDDLEELTL